MSALRDEMQDEITFEVFPIQSPAAEGISEKYFPDGLHGLLVFDAKGELQGKIDGHQFGRDEIVALIDTL